MNRSATFLVAAAAVALGGCGDSGSQDGAGQQAPAEQARATSAPDAKPGMSVADGELILPVVKGRPGAAYFTLTNGSSASATLAAVAVEGSATAEMHETKDGAMLPLKKLAVEPGAVVKFERGGKHVMAFGIADTVTPGSTAEMTLTFAGGDKLSVPLRVSAGGAAADDHGDHR